MNEIDFRNWLSKNNVNKKVQSDMISRIKRIEREIENCDIDEQYRSDKCEHLLSLFSNMGYNEDMKKCECSGFPIGKYSMNTFKHAIKQYIHFSESELL